MRKAEAAGNDDCPVKIKLVAPPLYVLTTQTLDKVCENPRTVFI
jgi:translation initiation factor 2 subunit 1